MSIITVQPLELTTLRLLRDSPVPQLNSPLAHEIRQRIQSQDVAGLEPRPAAVMFEFLRNRLFKTTQGIAQPQPITHYAECLVRWTETYAHLRQAKHRKRLKSLQEKLEASPHIDISIKSEVRKLLTRALVNIGDAVSPPPARSRSKAGLALKKISFSGGIQATALQVLENLSRAVEMKEYIQAAEFSKRLAGIMIQDGALLAPLVEEKIAKLYKEAAVYADISNPHNVNCFSWPEAWAGIACQLRRAQMLCRSAR